MFMYQNKEGHICVTFTSNRPVEAPEYVIAIDEAAKKLYMVSGTIEEMPEVEEEEIVEVAPEVVIPKVEELDDVVENDPPVVETVEEEVVEDEAVEEEPVEGETV